MVLVSFTIYLRFTNLIRSKIRIVGLRKWVMRKVNILIIVCSRALSIVSLAHASGTATGSSTTRRFSSNIKRRSISNVTSVTRSCTRDLACQYTACRYVTAAVPSWRIANHPRPMLVYFFNSSRYFGGSYVPNSPPVIVLHKCWPS